MLFDLLSADLTSQLLSLVELQILLRAASVCRQWSEVADEALTHHLRMRFCRGICEGMREKLCAANIMKLAVGKHRLFKASGLIDDLSGLLRSADQILSISSFSPCSSYVKCSASCPRDHGRPVRGGVICPTFMHSLHREAMDALMSMLPALESSHIDAIVTGFILSLESPTAQCTDSRQPPRIRTVRTDDNEFDETRSSGFWLLAQLARSKVARAQHVECEAEIDAVQKEQMDAGNELYAVRNARTYGDGAVQNPWTPLDGVWLNQRLREVNRRGEDRMSLVRQQWQARRAQLYEQEAGDPTAYGSLTPTHIAKVEQLLYRGGGRARAKVEAGAKRVLRALNLARQRELLDARTLEMLQEGGEEGMLDG